MTNARFAAIGLLALTLVGLFSTEMADPDAWWHLRTGRWVLENRRLPSPDPFSWTTASAAPGYAGEETTRRFNLTHEWLSQVLLYGVQAAGGFAALVLLKAMLLAGTCGLSGWIAARRTGSWLWGAAAAAAAASLAVVFTADRPALLTFFFVPLFIAIFESGRRLWLLPLFALFWANCHGGYFLGWVVCFAYSAEALLRRKDARRICGWSAAAFLASGLNPNGYGVLPTLLLYRRSYLTSTLIEWSKPYLWGPPYAFNLLLYGAAATMLASWRRVRISDWILFGLFAAAALSAFRNLILIGVLAPILIATYFPWKRPAPQPVAAWTVAAAALLTLIWGVAHGSFFRLRAAEWRYPAGAADFLRQRNIRAPLFNTYEYGGYLIWKGHRPFIDGRALSETVYRDYTVILGADYRDPARAEMLARYKIGAILVNGYEYTRGSLYNLVLALNSGMPEWKLVYEDPQAMVFLRDVPPELPEIPRGRILDHLLEECSVHVERDPEFSLCARDLGYRFLSAGDKARARRAFSLYFAHPYMEDPRARAAWVQLLAER